ncbi:anaerobic sulfatase maturase [Cytobacillus gottheilii]|nr:anaerobic sulfatase maturase [Cytobacillus gottheilii]
MMSYGGTATLKPALTSVMWKTVSEACNLACDYCYYSQCNGMPQNIGRIDDTVLEKFIIEYMNISKGYVSFVWQGGEPLLAGLDFFKKVVHLQAKYAPRNTIISNSIQTNGTLLNAEWASFFKEYNFLVGVSLDGPEDINDARRVTGSGKGSYKRIMRGIEYLKEANADFNILTVLHENNITRAADLMKFYQQQNFPFVQFIPCMDFRAQEINKPGVFLITPKQYGDFLCDIFDVWYNDGMPQTSIRFFDDMLAVYLNQHAGLCSHLETCPKHLVLEQNGDAYPCDFFIHEEYRLGNVGVDSLEDLLTNELMENFHDLKPNLPNQCKSCEFLHLCHGGCPRNRVKSNNESCVEYFCESHKQAYRYAHERMQIVATNVKKKRIQDLINAGYKMPGRNDHCICGSMKKFKKCCEPLLDFN